MPGTPRRSESVRAVSVATSQQARLADSDSGKGNEGEGASEKGASPDQNHSKYLIFRIFSKEKGEASPGDFGRDPPRGRSLLSYATRPDCIAWASSARSGVATGLRPSGSSCVPPVCTGVARLGVGGTAGPRVAWRLCVCVWRRRSHDPLRVGAQASARPTGSQQRPAAPRLPAARRGRCWRRGRHRGGRRLAGLVASGGPGPVCAVDCRAEEEARAPHTGGSTFGYKYIFKLLYGIIVLEGLVKVRFSFSTKTPSGAKWAPEGP